jgi:RHS repeat-associated protein
MIQGGAWTTPTPWVTLGLSNGSASVVGFGGVAAGTYEVTADYSGDGNNTAASASTTLSIENAGPGSSIYYSYSVPDGGYQSNGNVMAYTDSVMGSWNFGYDLLNRLVTAGNTSQPAGAAWAPYFCWAYDAFGNRLQQSTSNAAFTQGTGSCTFSGTEYQNTWASYTNQNQIASTNAPGFVWSPAYDGAGNITDDGSNQYLYDAEGRICAVASDGYGTGYLYDAAGNRVAKGTITSLSCDITTNGFQQTTGYVVGPGGEQITEVGANSTIWNHTNVYAEGKQIGTYDSAGLHLYVDDPLGTRRAQVLDSSGTLEAVYQSLPFGDGLNSIPYATGATDPTENHFTGKERDTESGNDYMFARYYNSATGRFLSPDWSAKEEPVPYAKLEYPQTLNLYSYVLNNPMTHSDPDGHKCGDAGQPACTAPGTTATPTSPQSDAKARATQAGEAAVNFTLAATKINTAIKTAPTSETVVGGLATAYLGISATGNAVAGTLQAGGAATGHTKVAEEGAEAVSTVTSVVGFGILLKTGDMNKAATGAAVEGILTSRPEDLATGGTLERAAKVADFGQNVSKVWSSIKSTVTEWIHPVAVQ